MAQALSTRQTAQGYKLRKVFNSTLTHGILIIGGIIWMYPFLWTLGTSLKSPIAFMQDGANFWPKEALWSNYIDAWDKASFGTFFMNTVFVSVVTVVLTVIITAMAGFVLARTQMPGKKLLIGIIAVTFFLPHGNTIIPVFNLIMNLGLLNTLWAVILVNVAGGMVFNSFMFMGYFSTVQKELDEAAMIDGASFNQRFWYIMLPLARPMMATVGLFTFISSWNNFFTPLIFTLGVPEMRTLAVGLYAFMGETSTDWTLLCAASIISLVPVMLVFAFAQKQIVNAVAGAVKA